jgi:endonuclease G
MYIQCNIYRSFFKNLWLFFAASICFFSAFAQTALEIPAPLPHEQIVHHSGYTFSYNESYEQANWVAYELTAPETVALFKRNNRFSIDSKVTTGTADQADYAHSGYDRGHLAPAADMAWSEQSMRESFYYSNMSPQLPSFNRGVWKRLEEFVRAKAIVHQSLYVVTGPILSVGLPSIGPHHVAVPAFFYKVLLDYTHSPAIGIGFIVPNKGSNVSLETYAVSIDEVEQLTGIDFFPSLPDAIEEVVERHTDVTKWFNND